MSKSCFPDRSSRAKMLEMVDLYPVISSEFCNGRSVVAVFEAIAKGGAKMVQLREKKRFKGEIYRLALQCREIANDYKMLLIINDHVDVALASGADGVHLGQDDLPLIPARMIAPDLLLGNSTHNLVEALYADSHGADYLNIGPIFPTRTKQVGCAALGIETLKAIAPQIHIPFTVMGGIKEHHIPDLIAASARHIAMVTEITQAEDITQKVQQLRSCFRR